jgi:CBS domain-containing protein
MDKAPLERLDSFPYRHRVAEVMRSPVAITDPGMTLEAAARRMVDENVSSLITLDDSGHATGIITERDILPAPTGSRPSSPARSMMSAKTPLFTRR